MSVISIGGKHSSARAVSRKKKSKKVKSKKPWLIKAGIALAVVVALYCTCVFSNIPFIKKWRTLYIETAMSTMRYQWLATAFIPKGIIDDVLQARYEMSDQQAGLESSWDVQVNVSNPLYIQGNETNDQVDGSDNTPNQENIPLTEEQSQFFQLFDELDKETVIDYANEHPEVVANGWSHFKLNETGVDETGTDMLTLQGERVMAIDAENGILILRIRSDSYKGVLAIVKDPSQVSVKNASTLGEIGQFAHAYASAYDALIVMGANGFADEGGVGNGGTIYGLSIADGVEAGAAGGGNYKRAEIRDDDHMYIVNSTTSVSSDTRDAAEFKPALIMDGEQLVTDSAGWGIQPRAIIAQSDDLAMMFMVIEGRQGVTNIGITLGECADILMNYGAVQALNMDGGSTAILCYEGEPITMCSNGYIYGRTLPNAFVVLPKS